MNRRIETPRIVIEGKRAPSRRLPWIVAVGALIVGLVGGFLLASTPATDQALGRGLPGPAIADADGRIQQLEQELAIARRGSQITDEANAKLRSEIVELEKQVAELRADVAFYQRLLGTGGNNKGLTIHELRLSATGSPNVFRFQLTLSQNLDKAKITSGRFTMRAEGLRDDRMVELDSAALELRPSAEQARYEFKYFQQIDGSLSLPDGFHPEALTVRLSPESGKKSVARRFEWDELFRSESMAISNEEED